MASWVVPSIAADIWGVSLEHVMDQVRAGSVPAREEFGFIWVDVTCGAPRLQPLPRKRTRRRRLELQEDTQRTVTRPELDALHAETFAGLLVPEVGERPSLPPFSINEAPPTEALLLAALVGQDDAPADPPEPDECESPEDPDDGVPMNWREVRARVAATRKPPGRA